MYSSVLIRSKTVRYLEDESHKEELIPKTMSTQRKPRRRSMIPDTDENNSERSNAVNAQYYNKGKDHNALNTLTPVQHASKHHCLMKNLWAYKKTNEWSFKYWLPNSFPSGFNIPSQRTKPDERFTSENLYLLYMSGVTGFVVWYGQWEFFWN